MIDYTDTEMFFIDRAKEGDGRFAIAATLNEVARSLDRMAEGLSTIAYSLDRMTDLLGTNKAVTPMGAIEALGKAIEDGLGVVAQSIHSLGDAIGEKEE